MKLFKNSCLYFSFYIFTEKLNICKYISYPLDYLHAIYLNSLKVFLVFDINFSINIFLNNSPNLKIYGKKRKKEVCSLRLLFAVKLQRNSVFIRMIIVNVLILQTECILLTVAATSGMVLPLFIKRFTKNLQCYCS